ncbi:hypothetical protein GGR50DRAFT_647925 [Xylaria sp. CBS 124048]|nr:hypothetical protein GGR50DRAFT_647925 [Xylaria sp. CBS 124048]
MVTSKLPMLRPLVRFLVSATPYVLFFDFFWGEGGWGRNLFAEVAGVVGSCFTDGEMTPRMEPHPHPPHTQRGGKV